MYTGGFVGANAGNITNIYASGNVTGLNTAERIGGFAGQNAGAGRISSSYTIGNVSSNSNYTGGFVGLNWNNSGGIESSYATGNVSSNGSYTGGFVGANTGGGTASVIKSSYATGNVSSQNLYTGGFAGANGSTSTIESSYAAGNVISTSTRVGGFVGQNTSGTVSISFSIGNVTGFGTTGGFAGENTLLGSITGSSSSGKVTGTGGGNISGFLGLLSSGTVDDTNYWNTYTSGQATSAGLAVGKTQSEWDAMRPVAKTWDSSVWDTSFENPVLSAIKTGNLSIQFGENSDYNSSYDSKTSV